MFKKSHKAYNQLSECIDIEKYRIISIVGGGGKTSTLDAISRYYTSKHIPHIVMTTTNMMYPSKKVVNSKSEIIECLKYNREIYVGTSIVKNSFKKLSSPSDDLISFIINDLDIPVLIEADGAKCKPLKLHRYYEPVILDKTDLVIGVIGIDSIDATIKDAVARPEDVVNFLNKSEDDKLSVKDVANIISSENGIRKDVASEMIILINKCDTKIEEEKAILLINNLKSRMNTKFIYGSYLN